MLGPSSQREKERDQLQPPLPYHPLFITSLPSSVFCFLLSPALLWLSENTGELIDKQGDVLRAGFNGSRGRMMLVSFHYVKLWNLWHLQSCHCTPLLFLTAHTVLKVARAACEGGVGAFIALWTWANRNNAATSLGSYEDISLFVTLVGWMWGMLW